MRQRLVSLGQLLALCFLLLRCSPSENSPQGLGRFGRLDYDIGQCDHSPFDGEALQGPMIQGAPSALPLFDKMFYLDSLERTLTASSYSIGERLHQEGVRLYRVPSPSANELSCRYFDFLPEIQGVAQQNWNKELRPGAQFLLGLFTTIYSKNNQTKRTRIRQPTIMLLDRTKRWTLLHEMSHYLFAKARAWHPDLSFNEDLEARLTSLDARIRELRQAMIQSGTSSQARALVRAYQQFFTIHFELDKRSALEEFTIEALLLDYAKQGRLPHMDLPIETFQAYNYMTQNGERVLFSYALFLDRLRALHSQADQEGWASVSSEVGRLITQIDGVVERIEFEIDQVETFRETPPRRVHDLSHRGSPLRGHHFDLEKFNRRHEALQELLQETFRE